MLFLFFSDYNIILDLIAVVRNVVNYSNNRELSASPHSPHLAPGVRGGIVAHDLFAETVFSNKINQFVQKDPGHFMHW